MRTFIKSLLRESLIREEDCISTVESFDEFGKLIEGARYDLDTCLIDECFEVIFNGGNALKIVNGNREYGTYISDSFDELGRAFEETFEMSLPIETINKLIILFIIEENSSSLGSIINKGEKSIEVDECRLYNYINLYDYEDGDILRKIKKEFVEEYKYLV